MTSPFFSKAIWLHMKTSFKNVDLGSLLANAGFQAVYLKCTDGPYVFRVKTNWILNTWEDNVDEDMVLSIRQKGIKVIGWGFNYGTDPIGEGKVAAQQVAKFKLDGWVLDVEGQIEKYADAPDRVYKIISTMNNTIPLLGGPDIPLGYCSWDRFTNAHPVSIAKMGAAMCDVVIPQAYWYTKEAALEKEVAEWYCDTAFKEWRAFTSKPIIMAGRCYSDGYANTVAGMAAFEDEAKEGGAYGSAWWNLDQAQPAKHPDWWQFLSDLPKYDPEGVPVHPPICPTCGQAWPY